MPVLHTGTFTLKDAAVDKVATTWFFGPDGSGGYKYFCTLLGPGLPAVYVATACTILDTSADGNGHPAAAPPNGFTPTTSLVVQTALGGVGGGSPSLGTIEFGSQMGSLATFSPNLPDGTPYIDLLAFLRITITSHGTTDSPEEATDSTFDRADLQVTGQYAIISFWWVLGARDVHPDGDIDGSNRDFQTAASYGTSLAVRVNGVPVSFTPTGDSSFQLATAPNPGDDLRVDYQSEYTGCGDFQGVGYLLSPDDPGAPYVRLDPTDDDAAPTPVVDLVMPDHGPTTGGLSITIEGSGYGLGAMVTIGGTPATSIDVQSSSKIVCTTPAHVAGSASVVVTNPDGVSS